MLHIRSCVHVCFEVSCCCNISKISFRFLRLRSLSDPSKYVKSKLFHCGVGLIQFPYVNIQVNCVCFDLFREVYIIIHNRSTALRLMPIDLCRLPLLPSLPKLPTILQSFNMGKYSELYCHPSLKYVSPVIIYSLVFADTLQRCPMPLLSCQCKNSFTDLKISHLALECRFRLLLSVPIRVLIVSPP